MIEASEEIHQRMAMWATYSLLVYDTSRGNEDTVLGAFIIRPEEAVKPDVDDLIGYCRPSTWYGTVPISCQVELSCSD